MKHEVESPMIKQTPSDQPVWLIKVTQTNVLGCFGLESASIAMKQVKKRESERKTWRS
jgi:hypothetical protein